MLLIGIGADPASRPPRGGADRNNDALHVADAAPGRPPRGGADRNWTQLEARAEVEVLLSKIDASSSEATALLRIGLLNYAAAALLMPYDSFLDDARTLRHDVDILAARYAVSYEQAAHRLSTLRRPAIAAFRSFSCAPMRRAT